MNIQLKAGTSILNISYKDEDKDLIIPLLNNMTNVYQDYSGKNKRRGIELTKIYLNKQINDYQLKSISSFKAAQDYAADQDLTILDISVGNNNSNISSQNDILRGIKNMENISINYSNEQTLANNTSIEVARVTAANQIRKNDSLIKKILT